VNFYLREPYNNIPLTIMCSRDQQDSASGAKLPNQKDPQLFLSFLCSSDRLAQYNLFESLSKFFWHLVHRVCTDVVQYTNIVYCIQQYLHNIVYCIQQYLHE